MMKVLATIGAAVLSLSHVTHADTAKETADGIWSKVTASKGSRGPWPGASLANIFVESMSPSMDLQSDEFPSGRSKLIHSAGVTARVRIDWNTNAKKAGYTGLFSSPVDHGIIRASSATEPDFTKPASAASFVPGIGLKLLRDDQPSANGFFMHLLKSWDTFNWFKYPLSNHLSQQNLDFGQQILAKKFATVSAWATHIGLSDWARYGQDGVKVCDPVFPFQLLFKPNPHVTGLYKDEFVDDYFTYFQRDLKSGITLYSIWAIPAPGENPVEIGAITTTSDFVTSEYADTTMFLRHQVFEEDLALRPEWTTGPCKTMDDCPVCPVDIACERGVDE